MKIYIFKISKLNNNKQYNKQVKQNKKNLKIYFQKKQLG